MISIGALFPFLMIIILFAIVGYASKSIAYASTTVLIILAYITANISIPYVTPIFIGILTLGGFVSALFLVKNIFGGMT